MKRMLFGCAVLSLVYHLPSASAQQHSATFVVTSGLDTVAAETFTTTPASLTGNLRLPQQNTVARYAILLYPDGSIAEADVQDDAPNYFSGTIAFDEKAAVHIRSETPRRRFIMAPPGTYPVIGTSVALMEELVRATHAATRDSTSVPVFNLRNRILGKATLRRIARDSLEIDCESCQRVGSHQRVQVSLSPTGDVTGGVEVGLGWVISRH